MVVPELALKPDLRITQSESEAPVESTSPVRADKDPSHENLYLIGRPTLKQFLRFVRNNAVNPPDDGVLDPVDRAVLAGGDVAKRAHELVDRASPLRKPRRPTSQIHGLCKRHEVLRNRVPHQSQVFECEDG